MLRMLILNLMLIALGLAIVLVSPNVAVFTILLMPVLFIGYAVAESVEE